MIALVLQTANPAPLAPNQAATPRGAPSAWVTADDYPPSAMRAGESGRVGYTVDVDATGRVTQCRVTQTSGSAALDQATCRVVTRRGRFRPATDAAAQPLPGSYSGTSVWQASE